MNIEFKDFIANQKVKAAITAAFIKDRLPQAIILQGEDGTGKKTLAKIIANIAVCTSSVKPCGVCPACIRANAGSHPDIKIEEGSGKSGNISVETIRNIIGDAQKKAEEAELNIYLLFVKNRLTEASQNKLLKIMEEPPGRALFIITVKSVESLLPTIRSRAVCFTLLPPSIEESAKFLQEKKDIEFDEALNLSKICSGNIGMMLGEKALPNQIAGEMAKAFDKSDEDAFLAICQPLTKDREMFALCLEQFRAIIRDAIIMVEDTNIKIGINHEESERISQRHRKTIIMKILDICGEYIELSKKNLNMNLLVTSFCAKLRSVTLI